MPTLDQRRAESAFLHVKKAMQKSSDEGAAYKRAALSFLALLHKCGLCQAVAFYRAESGAKLELVVDIAGSVGFAGLDDFTAAAHAAGIGAYQRLAREAMTCANWHKRYSEALITSTAGSGSEA